MRQQTKIKMKIGVAFIITVSLLINAILNQLANKANNRLESIFTPAFASEIIEQDVCGKGDPLCDPEVIQKNKDKEEAELKEKTLEEKIESGDWITAEFTAYNNVPEQCDDTPDITASGKRIKGHEKWIAVNGYKFGTKIEIEGMGIYTVEDRMNSRYGINNIDILFHKDMEGAKKFSRKNLRYRVIKSK